jgi:predicted HTH domain antitoxin
VTKPTDETDETSETNEEERLRVAIERYKDGVVGLRGAADITDRSIGETMRAANERGVTLDYDEAELAADVDPLR